MGNQTIKLSSTPKIFKNVLMNNKFLTKAIQIDVFDNETQTAFLSVLLGVFLGVGVPVFYASRDEADEKRLEGVRSLNRATKEATGDYMSEEEVSAIRPPRWTDRREFTDD